MFLKDVFVTLLFGTLAAAWQCGSPTMSVANQAVMPVDSKSLKLVSQYKRNHFHEISSDGNLLLFYEISNPVRTYTIQADGKGIANQPDTNTDVLRVVERASGRELGRMRVGFFPEDVQLIPGTQRVFYSPFARSQILILHSSFPSTSFGSLYKDPFAAQIGKLALTPDGKYLLSSTNDTLVWEVPSKYRFNAHVHGPMVQLLY